MFDKAREVRPELYMSNYFHARVEGKLSSVLMEVRMVQSGDQESVQAKDVITGVTN